MWGQVRQWVLGVSPEEVTFQRRGFRGGDGAVCHLEKIGRTFLQGYNSALEDSELNTLSLRLEAIEPELRGFAYEGTAMGLSLLDTLTPWKRNRLQALLDGPGAAYVYMVYVGVGWVIAKLHLDVERTLARLDPLLGWLAMDGCGFSEGYYHFHSTIFEQRIPAYVPYAYYRVFDQGLGRSLWFVEGADIEEITAAIAAFDPSRQGDLWSGVGLACAYAGGVGRSEIEALRLASGPYRAYAAQGAAFAAEARQRANNPAPHTELVCKVLCGISAVEAANLTLFTRRNLAPEGEQPAYEIWRRRTRTELAVEGVLL